MTEERNQECTDEAYRQFANELAEQQRSEESRKRVQNPDLWNLADALVNGTTEDVARLMGVQGIKE